MSPGITVKTIAKQSEYKSREVCRARDFWTWVVANNVILLMSHIFDHNQIPTFTDLRLPHAQIPEWKSLPLIRAVQPPPSHLKMASQEEK